MNIHTVMIYLNFLVLYKSFVDLYFPIDLRT